ncbi:hypothetical protein CCP2SC5_1500004 [Azospirillaceae bacterium]
MSVDNLPLLPFTSLPPPGETPVDRFMTRAGFGRRIGDAAAIGGKTGSGGAAFQAMVDQVAKEAEERRTSAPDAAVSASKDGSGVIKEVKDTATREAKKATLHKAAQEFEAMFFSQMLSHMWDNVPVDENFGGGSGEEMFRGLMMNEYSKKITERGGLGLAASVEKELIKAQEV